MKWYEITVNTNSESADLIADAFFSIGCQGGVKIIDKQDVIDILQSNLLWDYVDEDVFNKSAFAKVSGFVSKDELTSKLAELKEIINLHGYATGEITINEIDDESWYENWKKYYSPIVIGKYKIIPKWLPKERDGNYINIFIDPGMAFGTGEHESTKMCLSLMSNHSFKNKDVIDVGTGSGILGIAAALEGTKNCYMCDIDSIAVKAAKENALLNNIDTHVYIEAADLLTQQDKTADYILANLTADILIRLSKDLIKHIRKNGYLICSGIIHERKADVIDAYTSSGFDLSKEITMGDWDALEFSF